MRTLKPVEMVRIAITPYCDLRCEHCYASALSMSEFDEMEKQQMSMTQIQNFILDLKNNQKLNTVSITGGEILTQKTWPRAKELISFCLDQDLSVVINTSGSDTITVKDIHEVAGEKFNKLIFHISLDHYEEDWVNKFRGKDNAFRRAVQMISDVIKFGGYSEVRYTITQENYAATCDCYKMVSEMGASCFMAKVVFPSGRVYSHEYLKLDEQLVADTQRKLVDCSIGNKTMLSLPSPIFCDPEYKPEGANCEITDCTCGDTSLYIAFNGDILPCSYFQGSEYYKEVTFGNITDPNLNFSELWSSPDAFKAHRKVEKYGCATYKIMAGEMKGE